MKAGWKSRIVVLDDDPTGIQTVHGCLVLTRWDAATLRRAFGDERGLFYVLTNTRAYDEARARATVTEIMTNVLALGREFGDSLVFVSRSDSTLRSHFPVEIDAVNRALEEDGRPSEAIFMVPAFFEGGRITALDTHYVVAGGKRTPAGETEFAKDSVFGYRSSRLPEYIEEKTGGAVKAEEVLSVPLEMLREPGTARLTAFLEDLRGRAYVVVNSESYADLDRFTSAVRESLRRGRRFVFQSAASLVKSLAGVADKPLLGSEIVSREGRGFFVVGSHVRKTTVQLEKLLESPRVGGVELDVRAFLDSGEAPGGEVLGRVEAVWRDGRTPVLYTSRDELPFESRAKRLSAGQTLSRFLADVVRSLPFAPAYLVAKGGITSHDVLVRGLGVDRAEVLGQILPGVPVIRVPEGGRFAGMPYVIFPGNVGDEDAVARVFCTLDAAEGDA